MSDEMLKSIFKDNGRVILKLKCFTIKEYDEDSLWLEKDGGEGMTFGKSELMVFLGDIWDGF